MGNNLGKDNLFSRPKPVIGMIHVGTLPSTPANKYAYNSRLLIDFNSTLVRFKSRQINSLRLAELDGFNSTLVRFKWKRARLTGQAEQSFNSTLVRFKSPSDPVVAASQSVGFNSTLVRFKLK